MGFSTVQGHRIRKSAAAAVLSWQFAAEGRGTRLSLEHRGFDLDSALGKRAFHGMGNGWRGVISRLDEVVAAHSAT